MNPARQIFLGCVVAFLPGCGDSLVAPDPVLDRVSAGQGCVNCPVCETAKPFPGTLVVTQTPQLIATTGVWGGWWGATFESHANGRVYPMAARWNLVGRVSRGTVLQMVGGFNGSFVRTAQGWTYARQFQDTLAADGIRSVDVMFIGGSDVGVLNGWTNISAAYADVIAWLSAYGILDGTVVAYGNSGGASMLAAALVHQKVPLDGAVFGGGPFGVDFLGNGCSPQAQINDICFGDVPGGCLAASDTLRACRSLAPAGFQLPHTDLAVLVGDSDPRGAFISAESQLFLARMASRSSFFSRPEAPHQILASFGGFQALLGTIRGWIP